jgi:hypothetical protein
MDPNGHMRHSAYADYAADQSDFARRHTTLKTRPPAPGAHPTREETTFRKKSTSASKSA